MRDRAFRTVFLGKLTYLIALWALSLVVVILTYRATGSAAWVGSVTVAQLGPQLLLAPLSGRMSDQYGPLRLIVIGGLVSGLSAIGLAAWVGVYGLGSGVLGAVPLLIASLSFGCGVAVWTPAVHAIVPELVSSAELSSAVALNFVPTAVARTIGPAGGAALAVSIGPVATLAAVGVGYVVAALAIFLIRSGQRMGSASRGDMRIRHAVRYVRTNRLLMASLVGTAAIGAAAEPAMTLAPVIASSVGHAASGAGWVSSAFGVGGLVGIFAHRWIRTFLSPLAEGCVALISLGVSMAVVAMVGALPVVAGSLSVGGASMVVGITGFSTVIQGTCQPTMVGRVMSLWVIAFVAIRPAAGMSLGLMSDAWGSKLALLATSVAACLAAAGAWLFTRPVRSTRHDGDAAQASDGLPG